MYILRAVAKAGLLDVVGRCVPGEPETPGDDHRAEEGVQPELERVLHHIWNADDIPTAILMAPGKLQDKYCKVIKKSLVGLTEK